MNSLSDVEEYLAASGGYWKDMRDYYEVKKEMLSLLIDKKASLANVQLLFGDILNDIRVQNPITKIEEIEPDYFS